VREERKVVTVAFADLVGFTARSAALDPEDVRALVRPFHELLRREVERYGGTLARIVGDAGMAVFGYPTAHEDDPERAVRAGLGILAGLAALNAARPDLDLHVRIGMNTAEAVVTYGSALEDADDLMGDGVNVAARIQALAPMDSIVVGEETFRSTHRTFSYARVTPTAVKGKPEPLALWRPIGPIARIDGPREDASPFVGRSIELAMLTGIFERVRATGVVEVATIVADAGLGKSRLIRELGRYIDALPVLVIWRTGRCLPYGDGAGFWALGEIVKAHAGILETDDQSTLRAKLDAVLPDVDPTLRSWMADRLAILVGLDTDAEPAAQAEAFAAWRLFVESLAQESPTVVVIEDLHWATAALVAFLEHLADAVAGLPLLIVTTARPEVGERHPAWLGRARRATVLSLTALLERDMEVLVAAALGGAAPTVRRAVLERADGSPLYAEQLAAMLRDRPDRADPAPLDGAAIPATVAALIAARIDALPLPEKDVLLAASVVGKRFWSGAVAAASGRDGHDVDDRLVELGRRELVRPVRPSTMAGQAELSIWHALVRDVAYGQLTRADRLAKHRAVARWIEATARPHAGDLAEMTAHHYATAFDLAEATGSAADITELRGPAARALLLAGSHALGVNTEAALALLRRSTEIAGPDLPARAHALVALATAEHDRGHHPAAVERLSEAVALFRDAGDATAAADAMIDLNHELYRLGDPRAREVLREALATLEGQAPGPALVRALSRTSGDCLFRGEVEDAVAFADRAIELSGSIAVPRPSHAFEVRGTARCLRGDAGGLDDMRTALALDLERSAGWRAAASYNDLGVTLRLYEGPGHARELLELGVRWAGARGIHDGVLVNLASMQTVLFEEGSFDEALAASEALEARVEAAGSPNLLVEPRAVRSAIHALRGDAALVADVLPWLGSFPLGTGQNEAIVHALVAAAMARAALGEPDASRGLLARLEEIPFARTDDAWAAPLPVMVRTAVGIGDAALAMRLVDGFAPVTPYGRHAVVTARAVLEEARGDVAAAAASYAEAATRWEAFGHVPEHAHALEGAGRCLLALDARAPATADLGEARAIWSRIGARARVAAIDATLGAAS
jgi:class 3 adenylate cyclase/tetratricopeptide (TPR) repeat protein